jgi:hypothetical protein
MRVNQSDFVGKECSCGRPFSPVHCPTCGSGNVYGLLSQVNTYTEDVNGVPTVIDYPVFRCRRCTGTFNFHDCIHHCIALPINAKSIEQKRREDKGRERLAKIKESPELARKTLLEVLRESGQFTPHELGLPKGTPVGRPIEELEEEQPEVIKRSLDEEPVNYVDPIFDKNGKLKEDTK